MYIKPCPNCGRIPIIREGYRRKNGNRFYTIHCPSFCRVLKVKDKWSGMNSSWFSFEGNYDYNEMYKKWNEELIDKKGD